MKPLLLVIAGPTAVGKTAVSIQLAKHFQTEIISADSRQLYREMPIGTAAPSLAEQDGVVHHFIGSHAVTDPVDAGRYEREAMAILDRLFETKKVVVVCGGSGFYIDALCQGFDRLPLANADIRAELKTIFREQGIAPLQEELQRLDPEFYAIVDIHNQARLMRALEVIRVSGKPYSAQLTGKKAERPFRILKIALDLPRELLYDKINRRVELMIEAGLEAEALALLPHRELNSLQTVGYKEWFDFFDGKVDRTTTVELIQQHSRNYAKRQGTWLRRDLQMNWFDVREYEKLLAFIESEIA